MSSRVTSRRDADRAQGDRPVDRAAEEELEVGERELVLDRRRERVEVPERGHEEDRERAQVDHAEPAHRRRQQQQDLGSPMRVERRLQAAGQARGVPGEWRRGGRHRLGGQVGAIGPASATGRRIPWRGSAARRVRNGSSALDLGPFQGPDGVVDARLASGIAAVGEGRLPEGDLVVEARVLDARRPCRSPSGRTGP